jgi:glycerophosphoryl diester phosphodiesterase
MKIIIPVILLLCACTNTKKMSVSTIAKNPAPKFDQQGHRGCRGLMPENTIPAMLHALDLGVTTLEMDVVISKDSQVVVSHEAYFSHEISTKPDGVAVTEKEEKSLLLFAMQYSEVAKYDVGLKPHPRFPQQQKIPAVKPTLSALIDATEAHAKQQGRALPFYNIETKTNAATDGIFHPAPAPFTDMLMAVIQQKGIADRVIIQSFDRRTLQVVHQKYPSMKTALLINEDNSFSFEQNLEALNFNPDIYSPHYKLVNATLIEECHAKNIRIIPWTVNSREEIYRLKSLGVDGIITDFPNFFSN